MMKKKILIIIIASLSLLSIVGGVIANSFLSDRKDEDAYENWAEVNGIEKEPVDHDESETEGKVPSIVIPPDDANDEASTEKPDLDVNDMGRNPNAEIIDSKVEYDTKEVIDDAE